MQHKIGKFAWNRTIIMKTTVARNCFFPKGTMEVNTFHIWSAKLESVHIMPNKECFHTFTDFYIYVIIIYISFMIYWITTGDADFFIYMHMWVQKYFMPPNKTALDSESNFQLTTQVSCVAPFLRSGESDRVCFIVFIISCIHPDPKA